MSFYASNDRIRITDANGEVVFDTERPMPHIVQRISGAADVEYPNIPLTQASARYNNGPSPVCRRQEYQYVCDMQWVCETVQQCSMEMQPNGSYAYVCTPVQQCSYQYVCSNQWVDVDGDLYVDEARYSYEALDWQTVVDIGEVSDGIEADFLLVNAIAVRNTQGSLIDTGNIACGLPLGETFVANNSSIIESASDVSNGQPWMTRIMSVYVEGNRIKVEFKHSNRAFDSNSKWSGYSCSNFYSPPPGTPSAPSSISGYSFSFDIIVGKFTI